MLYNEWAKHKREQQPDWFDYLIRPIAAAVQELMPEVEVTCSGPGGLANTCFITAKSAHGKASVIVRPGPLSEAMVYMVDCSLVVNDFHPGTLGYVNGLNYGQVELPEVPGLVKILEAKLDELAIVSEQG
jgi:hypothetical protein